MQQLADRRLGPRQVERRGRRRASASVGRDRRRRRSTARPASSGVADAAPRRPGVAECPSAGARLEPLAEPFARPARRASATGGRSETGRALAETATTGALGPLAHGREDLGDLVLVERLLLEQLEHQVVEDVAVLDRGSRQASSWAFSMSLRTSSSTTLGDAPRSSRAGGPCRGRGRPRRASWPSLIAPSRSLMPYWVTIARATRGGLLDVVGGTGRRVVEDHLLGDPAAHRVGQLVEHLVAGGRVLVLVAAAPSCSRGRGRAAGSSPCAPGRCCGSAARHQGVPALVVGGDLLLLVVHQPGALLRAGDDAVDRLVERAVVDELARSVRAVSSAASLSTLARSAPVKPGRARGRRRSRSTSGAERLALGVHLEDLRGGPAGRARRRRSGGRSGPGAAAPGRGCRGGWSRRSG